MSAQRCPACIAQRVFASSYERDPEPPADIAFDLAWCMGAAHAMHAAERALAGEATAPVLCTVHEREVNELVEEHREHASRVAAQQMKGSFQ